MCTPPHPPPCHFTPLETSRATRILWQHTALRLPTPPPLTSLRGAYPQRRGRSHMGAAVLRQRRLLLQLARGPAAASSSWPGVLACRPHGALLTSSFASRLPVDRAAPAPPGLAGARTRGFAASAPEVATEGTDKPADAEPAAGVDVEPQQLDALTPTTVRPAASPGEGEGGHRGLDGDAGADGSACTRTC